jgi:hypothetical protein
VFREKLKIGLFGNTLKMLIALVACSSTDLFGGAGIDIESGGVFSGYNNVRVPGKGGTKISLSRELHTNSEAFFRGGIILSPSERNHFSFYAAPLRLHANGSVNRTIIFRGVEFPISVALEARYKFDTYRLTYRYDFHRSHSFEAGLGVTALLRDASVTLESDTLRETEKNVGWVPLINFRFNWLFAANSNLLLQGNALAAPQGRAEDVLLAFVYNASPNFDIKLGYRILEGGADVDSFYGFALINYAVLGVILSF